VYLESGFYVITPEKDKCSFEPSNYTVQNLSSDLYNMDFKSTCTKPTPCAAEEIYGENSKKIELFRYLRDNVLNTTPEGQELIRLYYELSPVIVEMMEEDEEFREEVKEMIDGAVRLIGN
jgi:hypothetical protein